MCRITISLYQCLQHASNWNYRDLFICLVIKVTTRKLMRSLMEYTHFPFHRSQFSKSLKYHNTHRDMAFRCIPNWYFSPILHSSTITTRSPWTLWPGMKHSAADGCWGHCGRTSLPARGMERPSRPRASPSWTPCWSSAPKTHHKRMTLLAKAVTEASISTTNWEALVNTGLGSQWQCRWCIWPCLISDCAMPGIKRTGPTC